jgi:hypothetical protein
MASANSIRESEAYEDPTHLTHPTPNHLPQGLAEGDLASSASGVIGKFFWLSCAGTPAAGPQGLLCLPAAFQQAIDFSVLFLALR